MNTRRICATWIGLSALTGGNTAVFAAEAENALTHVDVSRCVDLAGSADRLACYDAAAAKARSAASIKNGGGASGSVAVATKTAPRPTTAEASGTVPGTPTAQVSPTEKTPPAKPNSKVAPARAGDDDAATFGKTPAQVVKGVDGQQELHATVAALHAAPQGGAWIITLSNGQVWRQTVPEPFNLKQGYAVRIYPSRWGTSYRLSTEQIHGFIQVERIDSRE